MYQGALLNPQIPEPRRRGDGAVAPGAIDAMSSMAVSGFCARAHSGRIFASAVRRNRLAITGSSGGFAPALCAPFWKHSRWT